MITLNGHTLTKPEATALRTAITCFRMSLTKEMTEPNYMNEHKEEMSIIANGYDEHLARIVKFLTEDQNE